MINYFICKFVDKQKNMRAFENWTYEEVEDSFGIAPIKTSALFENWLNPSENDAPNNFEKLQLESFKNLLFEEVKNWNEDELKLFFIGPILGLVNLKTSNFKPFTQRNLSVTYNNITASGKMDFLLAKGKQNPKIPYFCLHEYKQENRRDNDPLGQLLIGMVAAHSKNGTNMPIFGTYISGRNWFFVLLEGKEYCLSNAYNAADEDIFKIFSILKKCKNLIEQNAIQHGL